MTSALEGLYNCLGEIGSAHSVGPAASQGATSQEAKEADDQIERLLWEFGAKLRDTHQLSPAVPEVVAGVCGASDLVGGKQSEIGERLPDAPVERVQCSERSLEGAVSLGNFSSDLAGGKQGENGELDLTQRSPRQPRRQKLRALCESPGCRGWVFSERLKKKPCHCAH